MTRFVPPPLEPAEYYYWHDGRQDGNFLLSRKQFDPDPIATAAIAATITARMDALFPVREPYRVYDPYFEQPNADIGPDLIARASAFRVRMPAALAHYDVVEDYAQQGYICRVVSDAWRAAIESVEPGVHQFFPHALHFKDGNVSDRFIIREGQRASAGGPAYFNADFIEDAFGNIIGYRLSKEGDPYHVTLDRECVTGRHWLREPRGYTIFVSRALAEKLHPLLPPFTALIAVLLTGEAPGEAFDGMEHAASQPQQTWPPAGQRAASLALALEQSDPTLAAALKTLSEIFALSKERLRTKAYGLIETRLQAGTAAQAFDVMEIAIEFGGSLQSNMAFQAGWVACHDLPENDVLANARAWARDANPRKRIAAARALSRPDFENPQTFATLAAMLDEVDPQVMDHVIGIIMWIRHPDYERLIKARGASFKNHPDPEVRRWFPEYIIPDEGDLTEEQEAEQALRGTMASADVGELFDTACTYQRNGEAAALDICVNMLHGRDPYAVARCALAAAHDADRVRRLIAARALQATETVRPPADDAIAAVRLLAVDSDKQVVLAAVNAFGALNGYGPYFQPHQIAAVAHLETHPDAGVRDAFAGMFAHPDSRAGLPILIRMSIDPAAEVRRTAAMHLQGRVAHLQQDKSALTAIAVVFARLAGDTDEWVRISAIEGLAELGDARATDTVLTELTRYGPEKLTHIENIMYLRHLMPAVIARPDRRYLPFVQRLLELYPDEAAFQEAVKACTIRRWFPWL